jgi:hypothetical protein
MQADPVHGALYPHPQSRTGQSLREKQSQRQQAKSSAVDENSTGDKKVGDAMIVLQITALR